jgi:hypothetical protein
MIDDLVGDGDPPPQPTALLGKMKEISEGANGSSSAASARSGFKMWEYVSDIGNWAQLLSGGDAVLFTYEMPLLSFQASFDVVLAIIPILPIVSGGTIPTTVPTIDIGAFGSASAQIDLAFGMDTYGIRKAFETGNFLNIIDGFYVSDLSLPQFRGGRAIPGTGGVDKNEATLTFEIGLSGGIGFNVFSAGLRGSIEVGIGLDMTRRPRP